jgi:hypothetical protein
MRRSLVQRDDAARHPFLQQLPRHVRHGQGVDPRHRHIRAAIAEQRADSGQSLRQKLQSLRRSSLSPQDVKDFLLAYCACFVAISAFIA